MENAEQLWNLIEAYGDATYSFALAEERGTSKDQRETQNEVDRLEREIRAMLKLDPIP